MRFVQHTLTWRLNSTCGTALDCTAQVSSYSGCFVAHHSSIYKWSSALDHYKPLFLETVDNSVYSLSFLLIKRSKITLVCKTKCNFDYWVAPSRWGLRHRKERVRSLGLIPFLWCSCLGNKRFKSLYCQSVSFSVHEGRILKQPK